MAPKQASWPELKYPSARDERLPISWIRGKQIDDGAEGLWRIHDGLYNLSSFINVHPGGGMWLQITKGTDVTEAFETHHLTSQPEKLLSNYYVRDAKSRRNSPYTFHSDGFYKTFKSKIRRHFGDTRPSLTRQSNLILDGIVTLALSCCILSAAYKSYYLATLAGFMMTMIVNCGHNVVHSKDNWRMYYYYLTTFSVREWRITHILSHHLYTNTLLDLEISLFEPLFQFLPESKKTLTARYLSWIYFPLALLTISPLQIYKRIKSGEFRKEDFLMFLTPVLMYGFGSMSLVSVFLMWCWIVVLTGFGFGAIGFTAAHHHPNIFHDGDRPREDRDWGLSQIDAVQDRIEIEGNRFLTLLIFGEHTLHHLLPTLDHALLPELRHLYAETLNEFGIESNMNTIWDLVKGAFKQLARKEKNDKIRKQKTFSTLRTSKMH